MEEGKRRISAKVMHSEKTPLAIAGFEDGMGGPQDRQCEQPLGAGKSKKGDLLLELPAINTALTHLDF